MNDSIWTANTSFKLSDFKRTSGIQEVLYLALIALMAYAAFFSTVLNGIDPHQIVELEQKQTSPDLF